MGINGGGGGLKNGEGWGSHTCCIHRCRTVNTSVYKDWRAFAPDGSGNNSLQLGSVSWRVPHIPHIHPGAPETHTELRYCYRHDFYVLPTETEFMFLCRELMNRQSKMNFDQHLHHQQLLKLLQRRKTRSKLDRRTNITSGCFSS